MYNPHDPIGLPVGNLLTPDELSAVLSIKPKTLVAWRKKNRGPRWLKVGRRVRYAPSDVNAWLKLNRKGHEPSPTSD